jgi:uncharacterized membrane-anchored protein
MPVKKKMVKQVERRNSLSIAGGGLLFVGAALYLYVTFHWYTMGSFAIWISATTFLAPFVAAFIGVGSIVMLFLGGGLMLNVIPHYAKNTWAWRLIAAAGIALMIVTQGTMAFWIAVLAYVLAFVGTDMASSMLQLK